MAEPRSALGSRAADLVVLEAVEVPFLTQIDVRCAPRDAARIGFPSLANTVAGDLTRGVLWLGPDEWLVVGLPGTARAAVEELEHALDGVHQAIVDVSENRAVLELRGADRSELLASGCSLDLDPRGGWVPGVCAQTMFARAQVILQELQGATRIFVRPSFAHYLVDRLLASRNAQHPDQQ
jgi:sarcosine oxidase subunit gamma